MIAWRRIIKSPNFTPSCHIYVVVVVVLKDLLATEQPDRAATEIICHAHQHEISCISVNQSGTRVATSSAKVSKCITTYLKLHILIPLGCPNNMHVLWENYLSSIALCTNFNTSPLYMYHFIVNPPVRALSFVCTTPLPGS